VRGSVVHFGCYLHVTVLKLISVWQQNTCKMMLGVCEPHALSTEM
jgi:hypothetical protein